MRFIKFAVLAALFALPVSSADAGVILSNTVHASALFSTSGISVQRSDTANGVFTDVGVGDLTVLSTSLNVVNTATLDGVSTQNLGLFTAADNPADTLQAFIGTGPAPAENTFDRTVPTGTLDAFARTDSNTTGTLLDPGGLNTDQVAEIEAGNLSLGSSISSSTGSAGFLLSVAEEGFYRISLDATSDLLVSSIGPPLDRVASAETALTIQINGTQVSLDSPNGLLTQTISGDDATGFQEFFNITTEAIFLEANIAQSLSIGQSTSVRLEAVPEPTSALVFAGVAVIGLVRRRNS